MSLMLLIFTVSEKITSIYGSSKEILTSVIELFKFEIAFLSKLSEKYQGIPAVQACKTKLMSWETVKHLALWTILQIENSWQQWHYLFFSSIAVWHLWIQLTRILSDLRWKNPVYFNPDLRFLPSDSIPHSGHWKLPIFHWWCHQESLHQSMSAQVPGSGFDYQLGDVTLIPGTN